MRTRELRAASPLDAIHLADALLLLRDARKLIRDAGCPQAYGAVRRAIKSAEGAQRHMQRRLTCTGCF